MTPQERELLVTELRELATAIAAGKAIEDEKHLIRNITRRLLEEVKAPAMARNIALGFFR